MSSGPPNRAHPYEVLLGRWSAWVAVLVVLTAGAGGWLLDRGGGGLELCWLRAISGLPCPGCGLTRSVCHLARGDFATSIWFHGFGIVVLPFSLVAASSLIWPRRMRVRLRNAIDRHRRGVELTYLWAVALFLGHGLLRLLLVVLGVWPGWD